MLKIMPIKEILKIEILSIVNFIKQLSNVGRIYQLQFELERFC